MVDAVYNDEERVVLHWVMEKKRSEPEWREQVENCIDGMREEDVGYQDWTGWEAYVKDKVEKGKLPPECLSVLEDSGGKKKAKRVVSVDQPKVSPAKDRRPNCIFHGFKEETNKKNAIKGKGGILDDIVCEGINGIECGKEFVFVEADASDPAKACIVGMNNPAWWCNVCNLVLCNTCHASWCDANTMKRGRRLQLSGAD